MVQSVCAEQLQELLVVPQAVRAVGFHLQTPVRRIEFDAVLQFNIVPEEGMKYL